MKKDRYYAKIALDVKKRSKERIIAIHRVKSQRVLYKIATHDDNPKIRIEAVKEITNNSYLKSIARYDEKMHIRIAAVEKISDCYMLYTIAKSKKYDSAVRRRAIEVQRNATYLRLLNMCGESDYIYVKM